MTNEQAESVARVVAELVNLFTSVLRWRHATRHIQYIIINAMLPWAIIAAGKPKRLTSVAHRTCGASASDKSSQSGFDEDMC